MWRREPPKKLYEEYAYVLDFLPHGRTSHRYRAEPVTQLVGEMYFTLLEAVVKPNVTLSARERVYIGKDAKDKIDHIRNRLAYDELTLVAKSELATVIEELVRNQEGRFIAFFNNASAITPRMHALELIPGIGKKYMWGILDQREKRKFEDYEDLQKRTGIPDPTKLLVRRILDELEKEEKYRLFTRP